MSVRRTAALLSAGLAGLVTVAVGSVVAAPPGVAAPGDQTVAIRNLSSDFKVGGGPGSLAIVVSKRSRGCIFVRRTLTVRLDGLAGDQLRVERLAGGEWRRMPLAPAGSGAWTAAERSPDPRPLCAGDSIVAQFRVAFLGGAPAGVATFVAQAFSSGQRLGSDSASRKVSGPPKVTPTPTRPAPTPTVTPTASPTPTLTTAPPSTEAAPVAGDETGAAVVPVGGSDEGSGLGIGAVVMALGLAMVAIGAGLLVVLLRRSRGEPGLPGEAGGPGDGGPAGPGGGPGGPGGPGPDGGDSNPTLVLPPVRG